MNKMWLGVASLFAATCCLAQVLGTAPSRAVAPHTVNSSSGVCLLGSDCLNVSKTPVKACLVAKDSKAPNGCAIDGMKFISKLAAVERRT